MIAGWWCIIMLPHPRWSSRTIRPMRFS